MPEAFQAPVYVAGGTVQAGNGIYVSRAADEQLFELCRRGELAFVLRTRQIGKSSLMVSVAERLIEVGSRPVIVDLTRIGTTLTADQWYQSLLMAVAEELGFDSNTAEWWDLHRNLAPTDRFCRFFREVVLQRVSERVIIFVDEIDTTLKLEFTDDFFAAIRALHLGRSHDAELWRLSFVLIGVATPSSLIKNPERTPFNLGRSVEITDFTLHEAQPLVRGLPVSAKEGSAILEKILDWTGGHPYLTLRVFRSLHDRPLTHWTPEEIEQRIRDLFLSPAGEGDSNLRFVRDMLTVRATDSEQVLKRYQDILQSDTVEDYERDLVSTWLKLSGVVKSETGQLVIRNRIYRETFTPEWVNSHMPFDWRKQLVHAVVKWVPWLVAITALPVPLMVIISVREEHNARQAALAVATANSKLQGAERVRALAEKAVVELHAQEAEAMQQIAAVDIAKANALATYLTAEANVPGALRTHLLLEGLSYSPTVKGWSQLMSVAPLLGKPRWMILGGARSFNEGATRFASIDENNTIAIWDTATKSRLESLKSPEINHNDSVIISPDGSLVATAGEDAARIWETRSGKQVAHFDLWKELRAPDPRDIRFGFQNFAFSPDSRLAATVEYGKVALWNVRSGELLARLGGGAVLPSRAIFSPDGSVIAADTGGVDLWETASGKSRCSLNQSYLTAVVFSWGGKLVATAGDRSASVWDTGSCKKLFTIEQGAAIAALALGPDGKMLATASRDMAVRLWDVPAGLAIGPLDSPSNVNAIAFSPDGKLLATAGDDKVARIWNVKSRRLVTAIEHPSAVRTVGFTRDGQTLATTDYDGNAGFWNIDNNELPRFEHDSPVTTLSFRRDSAVIATATDAGKAFLWEAKSSNRLGSIDYAEEGIKPLLNEEFGPVLLSPDGGLLATASGDTVVLWNTTSHKAVARLNHEDRVNGVAFSPEGRTLATVCKDETVHLWDRTGRRVRSIAQTRSGLSIAFSPDARLLATGGYSRVFLWRGVDLLPVRQLVSQPPEGWIDDIAFSPDGKLIAASVHFEGVRVWEADSGKSVSTLSLPHNGTLRLAFSPDGRLLVIGGQADLHWWDVASRSVVANSNGADIGAISFSPDGRYLAVATDKVVQFQLYRLPDLVKYVCGHLGFPTPPAVWRQYIPDEPQPRTCPNTTFR